ncbi:E3 ubiquitin-protein ligase RNF220 isoform X2 [Alosa alosa]|uniref:E3 ubiquitin-protein ligase RNF220 isoform X2 n=1 Tax=Alosa alosa TaxID=278164 RepID=UPI002015499C|nr:E3 ubiquitin-protein ligase RNF220 isoform X2 [Alosa alosa]
MCLFELDLLDLRLCSDRQTRSRALASPFPSLPCSQSWAQHIQMDLHRAPFKMDSPSYLPNPLASPALMVLASTAEAGRDASIPCQPPRPFGVPVSMEKDVHLPFAGGAYTFTSMYHHRQGAMPGGFPGRDFPASLLHLHPQFAPPNLDCSPLGILNHGGVGAFRPFSSPPEERDGASYQSAFTPAAKRLKACLEPETSPHLRYTDVEGKEYDFAVGTHVPSCSPGSRQSGEDAGKKLYSMSGLLSDGEASSSPEERKELSKVKGRCEPGQVPVCPICQVMLRPGELQSHMEQEMERLAQLHLSKSPMQKDSLTALTPKSLLIAMHIKREGDPPITTHPLQPTEDVLLSDRYQTFLRVRANRQTRLNVRIGKFGKRQKTEESQRDGVCVGEDVSVDIGREDYMWSEKKRQHMASFLRGIKGVGFVSSTSKENHDSDADLDVDGDDTLEYGKAQYTEVDVIPCSGEDGRKAAEREARKAAALNGGVTPPGSGHSECSKWTAEEAPSTSNGENSKLDSSGTNFLQGTCKNSTIDILSKDSGLTTLEALKCRIRDLEKQLSRGDRYKCLICMDCYTIPLTSIQCWHVHCEECWLRTLGAKKLCPQCNTITSPGDLRRVYL